MRRHEKLLTELATALRAKSEAKQAWADKRAEALEARGEYNEKVKLVEEIQEEIETGSTGRPILDEIAAKEATPPPAVPPPEKPAPPPPKPAAKKKAARQDQQPKLAGVEFPTASQIFRELMEHPPDQNPTPPATDKPEPKPAPPPAPMREPTIAANGVAASVAATGFTTPTILQHPRPENAEDRKPIRRQTGRGPR